MLGKHVLTRITRCLVLLSLLSALLAAIGSSPAAGSGTNATGASAGAVKTSSLGAFSPTFVGPAATGCASGCNLLSGPYSTPSTKSLRGSQPHSPVNLPDSPRALPLPRPAARGR